jgi:hypothetical protein
MAKRIKHVSELPAWFKLEKYDFTKNLDAQGWYEQLSMRGICLYRLIEHLNDKTQPPKELKSAIQALRENPNTNIHSDKRLEDYFPYGSNLLHLLDPQTNTDKLLGITPITTNNPFYNSYQAKEDTNKDTIKINLSLPDSLLIENFKRYLSAQRKIKEPASKHFRESDFSHWSKLGVLPYLDLIILEYETNSRISNRILADALYPSGEKGEETIRKTTSPLSNQLISFFTLHQLAAQAALKILEKNES